jgi:hypothetical protein
MGKKLSFLVWVWFMLWGFCVGRFVVKKNSLRVTSPSSLEGVYPCAIGKIGVPQFGGSMVGIVAYPISNRKACKSFDLKFRDQIFSQQNFKIQVPTAISYFDPRRSRKG